MSDQQESTPSFFKVIRYPSAGYLSLPNAFVRRYFNKIPKNPTLVTATGEHSWRMKLVKIGEDYCFAHGWDELVKDAGLCSRDVVVFWLMDSRIFRVSFLGANGCEKYVPVNKTSDVVKDDGKCHNDDANLCFERVFGHGSFKYYMLLPIKFVKAAGLEHKESVKLKDHEGIEWTMRLTAHGKKGSASVVYSLSAGWAMFRKHYKLSEGDVGTFTFDKQQGVINLTQLIKSKRPIKQETPMGAQSCYGDANVQIDDQWSPTEKPCSSGGAGVKVNKTRDEYDDVVKDDGKCHNDDDANLCFERVIGHRSFGYYMLLPTKFVKAAGLEHKESVKLKDHEGKEWTMRLITARGKRGYSRVRYCLSAGWAMFRKHYRLSEGDVGIFTFDKQQGVINLTQLIKSKRPIKQETPMGTQSCYGDANVQIEDQWSPTEKPCSSGGASVKVKTEYESGPEMVVVKENRGRPPLKRFAEAKIEWVPEMMRKPKREVAPLEKPSKGGGVEVNAGMGAESVFRSKHVYF
ncbi:putative transcription factor B3-Domain family [Helianthus annuus]|uniref:Putative DNA-binding pseudobarrel domain-containing protein n=1 Tax=Helianthus annuus TaxID=4232 RepID=A0A251UAF7_HELAN|nr:B3 domain-containing protein REM10 isoform X2 [Helianthus annuus]KAF5754831.1 putative transcription factor B3-Domain family [Helianthus annuus]KAJ0428657.1 putative transcription factor B3-Domain family [Helianthus annuus]KAJ0432805.1 putative transcription factor B3-Domain family [Helianthus annuus]KAJ0812578.1 putative transcription factor B3-Domain family [Helianthus annuus]